MVRPDLSILSAGRVLRVSRLRSFEVAGDNAMMSILLPHHLRAFARLLVLWRRFVGAVPVGGDLPPPTVADCAAPTHLVMMKSRFFALD